MLCAHPASPRGTTAATWSAISRSAWRRESVRVLHALALNGPCCLCGCFVLRRGAARHKGQRICEILIELSTCWLGGADASSVFVVFITAEYIRKCAERGAEDNCHAEFSYAVQRKGVQKVVSVVMEPELLNTATWRGPVGLRLNGCVLHAPLRLLCCRNRR
jgi:hypothetical protein